MNQLFCPNSNCHLGAVKVETIEGCDRLWKITPNGQTPWMIIAEKPRCPHCHSLLENPRLMISMPMLKGLAA